MQSVRTQDLEEAIASVGRVYCPHRLTLDPNARRLDTRLHVLGSRSLPVVGLKYGAPVAVDAGTFADLTLIMTCDQGDGTVSQAGRTGSWSPGVTLAVSAGSPTTFSFGREYTQTTLRLDPDRLERQCGLWLGHPLDKRLRFDLRPFSPTLQHSWTAATGLIKASGDDAHPLPSAAAKVMDEFVHTLLLHGHPHNYSDALNRPPESASARVARRARDLVDSSVEPIVTVSDLAAMSGASIRTLQASLQSEFGLTPTAYLRRARLQRAREELRRADSNMSVTDVAMQFGFVHLGRFAMQYKSAFGESPSQTRNRALR